MKPSVLSACLALGLISLIPGCQSSPTEAPGSEQVHPAFSFSPIDWKPAAEHVPAPPSVKIGRPERLSDFVELPVAGQSLFPGPSPSGEKLVYTSFGRTEHANQEIYEYDLEKKSERRLTFQRGEVLFPAYHPHQQKVIYASSNEEEIERPDLALARLRDRLAADKKEDAAAGLKLKLPPTEIFLRDLSDLGRDRLTDSAGFDGEARFIENGRRILFSSARSGDVELYTMDSHGKQLQRLTSRKGYDGMAHATADGDSRVWTHLPPNATESQLLVSRAPFKKIETVPLPPGVHWSPQWHRDGGWILFSSDFETRRNFALYAVRPDGGCLTRLTSDSGHAIHPAIHPTSDRLFYSRFKNGRWTLGWRDFSLPKTCALPVP